MSMEPISGEEEEKDNEVVDNYIEHPLHFKNDPQCSTCFSERKKGVDEVEVTNMKQANNLAKLRASIEAQRSLRITKEMHSDVEVITHYGPKKLELRTVPEIKVPDNTEFSLERHTQLCQRAEVLYHNFLVAKQNFSLDNLERADTTTKEFEEALKELCESIDSVVNESSKVRWS